MINWDYNANDYDVTKTGKSNLLPEGKYRVRIIEAYQTKAYNGTEGLEIWLGVLIIPMNAATRLSGAAMFPLIPSKL